MFDIIGMLKGVFDFGAKLLGFADKKTELNNTPVMQKRADSQNENNEDDKDAQAIENGDIDDARNRLS